MKLPSAYSAHEVFIAPARPKSELWRFVIGLLIAFFCYITLNQVFFQIARGFWGKDPREFLQDVQAGDTPVAMYVLLVTFGFMSVAVGIAASLLHQRNFATLLGPLQKCGRDFSAVSFHLIIIMALIFILPPWGMDGPLVPNLDLGTWILLLVPSLVLVLVQTSAEEIVFRGYIQQQLAARFESPFWWMILPAALFAVGHYLPDMAGENALLIAIWAGVFGVLMADLTARSGSLGPAIAVHFWNNVSAMLVVSLPGDLSALALYHTPFSATDTDVLRQWLWVDFAFMIVLWLAARLAIRR